MTAEPRIRPQFAVPMPSPWATCMIIRMRTFLGTLIISLVLSSKGAKITSLFL